MCKAVRMVVTVILIVSVLGLQPSAAVADAVMDAVPADCLFCVRLNNLDQSLMSVDQYLMGVSPMGLTMLVKSQLAGIVGDPMLTGINTQGTFTLFAIPTESNPMGQIALLIPVTDFGKLTSSNPNISETANAGVYRLMVPNSPLGETVMTPVLDDKYALAAKQTEGLQLTDLAARLGQNGLGTGLPMTEHLEATNAHIWAYANGGQVNQVFGPMIQQWLMMMQQQVQSGAAAGAGMDFGKFFNIYSGLIQSMLTQTDFLSLSMQASPSQLRISETLAATSGTDMANALAGGRSSSKPFTLAGLADHSAPMQALFRMDAETVDKVYGGIAAMVAEAAPDALPAQQVDAWRKSMREALASSTTEAVCSISYGGEAPFMSMVEVATVENPKAMRELAAESSTMIEGLYKAIGFDCSFDYKRDVEQIAGSPVDEIAFKMDFLEEMADANAPEMMMDSFDYRVAYLDKHMVIAMGADGSRKMREVIGKLQSAPTSASGELKMAMDMLPDGANRDFIVSYNYVKLMAGMGGMMQSVGGPQAAAMAEVFSKLKADTSSTMAFGGQIEGGAVKMDFVLPKQHLMEIIGMVGQMQQHMQPQPAPAPAQ